MTDEVASPCVALCALDPTAHWCIGCGRTLEEIAEWQGADGDQRRTILAKLPERLAGIENTTHSSK